MEISEIVAKTLSLGFLIDAKAFEFISKLPSGVDVSNVLQKVIENKKQGGLQDRTIKEEDVRFATVVEGPLEAPQKALSVSREESEGDLEIIIDPSREISPLEADDGYKRLFRDRYERLLGVFRNRPDTRGVGSILSAKGLARGQRKKIAGLVLNRKNKGNSLEIVLDDPTGTVRIQCQEGDASRQALRLQLDSLVAVEVLKSKSGQLLASSFVLPDIPDRRQTVVSSHEGYAMLLSDLHVGSQMFLEHDFKRLLLWLNGKLGDSDIVSRIRYVVIAGDVVDGVGIYPGQEFQLIERNLKRQYDLAATLLNEIPEHVQILVSPGNHDAVRQALPQPGVAVETAELLHRMENVKIIGNPSYVKLDGVGVLIYHGKSFDDVIAATPELTYKKPTSAMKLLLRTRHLAPTYGKRTAISPEARDMLVVDPVPEVMHSGHVHTFDVDTYRGTLLVNSGTFQAQTSFQANMGLEPTPSIVPILNLSNLTVVRRSFGESAFGPLTQ